MMTQAPAFEIEKILDETVIDDKPHYLIKWKGYCSTQSTWQPIENLIDTLDMVHAWKVKNNPHSIRKPKLDQAINISKTKKIGGKEHQAREKVLNDKLQSKVRGQRRKKQLHIDQDDILSIESQNKQEKDAEGDVDEYSFGQECRPSRKTRSKTFKKQNDLYQPKNTLTTSKAFDNSKKSDVSGFRIIGKVTKQGVQSVLWCFDWQDKKICQVQLKDGRKVNMRRQDVKKICPEKLCEYYEKLEKTKF